MALHADGRYAVQLRVDTLEPDEAAVVALSRWRRVMSGGGRYNATVVRAEVMTVKELEADMERFPGVASEESWEAIVDSGEAVEGWAQRVLSAVHGDQLDAFCAALSDDDPSDLYDHAPCGYLSTLPDGTVVKVNQTFLAWTGFERHHLVGRKRFVDLLSVGGRIYYDTHYAPLLFMHGSVREIAAEIVCADGRRMPVLLNSVLRRDRSGNPVVIRTAVFDATERRAYEQELLRARQSAEQAKAEAHLLAETLQASLMPPEIPAVPGIDIGAVYRPAGHGDEVGGDFYDVFETPGGGWGAVIGDVCGKGVEAAKVATLARHTLRAVAMRVSGPSAVLATLNRALRREGSERFCTAAYLRLRPLSDGRIRVALASGGHPLPLLVEGSGQVRAVGRSGLVLGVFDHVDIRDTAFDLRPGQALVLYTDGVTEARGAEDVFGDDRLGHLVAASAELSAGSIARRIVDEVLTYQGGLPSDDIAVVVIKASPDP